MKIYLLFIILIVFVFSLNAINLIQNPGFENWTGDTLSIWTVDNAVNITKNSTDVHSGLYAIDITTTSTSNRGIWQQIPITGGGNYIYSVWVKANGVSSNGLGILVSWRSSDGSYMSSSPTMYNTDSLIWEYVCDTVIAPDTAAIADIKIRGYMNSGYAGIVDDADFEYITGVMQKKTATKKELSISYSNNKIKIDANDKEAISLYIFDIAGNLRYRKDISGSCTLETKLDRGVYFIIAKSGKIEVAKKAVMLK